MKALKYRHKTIFYGITSRKWACHCTRDAPVRAMPLRFSDGTSIDRFIPGYDMWHIWWRVTYVSHGCFFFAFLLWECFTFVSLFFFWYLYLFIWCISFVCYVVLKFNVTAMNRLNSPIFGGSSLTQIHFFFVFEFGSNLFWIKNSNVSSSLSILCSTFLITKHCLNVSYLCGLYGARVCFKISRYAYSTW